MTGLGAADIERALAEPGMIRSAYQPIQDLRNGATVAYEALARFDDATGITRPDLAFEAASLDPDLLVRLDHACMEAAVRGALEGGFPAGMALFVNVLPSTLTRDLPPALEELLGAADDLCVVAEVTEVGVTARPAELLSFTAACRGAGFGVAIDDVGVNPDSLALLPLLNPDVIKLDRSLLSATPTAETGRVLTAVLAAQETTGAAILAEGIEDAGLVDLAIGLGASLGQGWHLGRPGPLPDRIEVPAQPLALIGGDDRAVPVTPFSLVGDGELQGRNAPYEYLLAISMDLEAKAARLEDAIVASSFQESERFTRATAERYEWLAGEVALVAALAEGLEREPARGVRGGSIAADDDLRHDWNVVVLAPHFSAALIARDRTASGPVRDRRYDYALTHDPELVMLAAHSLLDRLISV